MAKPVTWLVKRRSPLAAEIHRKHPAASMRQLSPRETLAASACGSLPERERKEPPALSNGLE